MQVEWYGQSAFRMKGAAATVFIDPFEASALGKRGLRFEYPPIEGAQADLLLVTHEHADHNAVDVVAGDPTILRSTAGLLQSPIGDVLAIASEHDTVAGTRRGPNTIFCFELDGTRVCHFGDFGQDSLRPEQAEAIGAVDLLFLPVGAGPTIGPTEAHAIVKRLRPRCVVPMHYRTPRIDFLEPADAFLELFAGVNRLPTTVFDLAEAASSEQPIVLVPATP